MLISEAAIVTPKAKVLHLGSLRLDLENHFLLYPTGQKNYLRPKEFQLLYFLSIHQNRIVNKASLLEMLWQYDAYSPSNTLEVHISSLRKKLLTTPGQTPLETIHGAGYRLNV